MAIFNSYVSLPEGRDLELIYNYADILIILIPIMMIKTFFLPLVNVYIAVENHRSYNWLEWVNKLFLLPFSIAMLNYQRVVQYPTGWGYLILVFRGVHQEFNHVYIIQCETLTPKWIWHEGILNNLILECLILGLILGGYNIKYGCLSNTVNYPMISPIDNPIHPLFWFMLRWFQLIFMCI